MALPFIAGIAAGALAVVAWNKRDEIKIKACESFEKSKELVSDGFEKGKTKIEKITSKVAKKPIKKPAKKPGTTKKADGKAQ